MCYILKDGNLLHPLAVTLLVSLVRVKSTVKYIICVIKYSHVQAFIENCIQLMLLFLKIKVLVLRKCVNGSAWASYSRLVNLTCLSTQISSSIKFKLHNLCWRQTWNQQNLKYWKNLDQLLGKLISKLELKLEKWKKLELTMYSNLKFGSSLKLEFDKKWTRSSTM